VVGVVLLVEVELVMGVLLHSAESLMCLVLTKQVQKEQKMLIVLLRTTIALVMGG
jgi:hypothetical protein